MLFTNRVPKDGNGRSHQCGNTSASALFPRGGGRFPHTIPTLALASGDLTVEGTPQQSVLLHQYNMEVLFKNPFQGCTAASYIDCDNSQTMPCPYRAEFFFLEANKSALSASG